MRKHLPWFTLLVFCSVSSESPGQWTKFYQSDSCYCSYPFGRWPIRGMAFFGSDSGVIIDNYINTTTDGGSTWHRNNWDSTIVKDWSFAFSDINHFWIDDISYTGLIHRTSNAGITWEADSVNDSMGYYINVIYFADSANGYAGADGLTVLKTTDAGKNWSRVHGPEREDGGNYYMEHIAFSDQTHGLAASGNFGTWILRTNDGGATWTNVSTPSKAVGNFSPSGLSYPDPAHAFFTNSYGDLHYSDDSGKTWTLIQSPEVKPHGYRSIAFFDSLHGIAALGGKSLNSGFTSDGGKTWKVFNLNGDVNTHYYTSFPKPQLAYVGSLNAVYKLNIEGLKVDQANNSEPSLIIDRNIVSISMPQNSGGEVQVVDVLGRIYQKFSLGTGQMESFRSEDLPSQAFIMVYYANRFKVFKILH